MGVDDMRKYTKKPWEPYRDAEGKEIIQISFSGGRTSAYLTYHMMQRYKDEYSFVVTFANTGREHPATLEYVHQCDVQLGFNTVWLEAVVHPEVGKACTHKIVTFETACRDGSVFEEVIKKYGIPNHSFAHCTERLKLWPMRSYLKSLGLKERKIRTAIGIRADETRRVNEKNAATRKIIYPLVDWGVDKEEVLDFWRRMPFDLQIPEHLGNCVGCVKKSVGKHALEYRDMPEAFDWLIEMEAKYSLHRTIPERPRVFHRDHRSTLQLIEVINLLDVNNLPPSRSEGGCSESCEVYGTGAPL